MSDAGTALPSLAHSHGLVRSNRPVLILLTVAVALIAALLLIAALAERDARRQAKREGDALIAAEQVLQAVSDAETAQRGYLLTGRDVYLTPYDAAGDRVRQGLAALRAVASTEHDTPALDRIAALDRAATVKLDELARTIALARSGQRDAALRIVNADLGRRDMDTIRRITGELGAGETRRWQASFDRAARTEQAAVLLIALLGAAVIALLIVGYRIERRLARVAAEVEQAAMLRRAHARSRLLARELNHRVKNLFAVVEAIVAMSGRKQAPAAEVVADIRARIHALSMAHDASQGGGSGDRIRFGELVHRILAPYDISDGEIAIEGDEMELEVRDVTPLGLVLHELATNAVKYGALSARGGRLSVSWTATEKTDGIKELHVNWIESGVATLSQSMPSPSHGYGLRMIALAAQQLGGQVDRSWREDGLITRLTIPVALDIKQSGPIRSG